MTRIDSIKRYVNEARLDRSIEKLTLVLIVVLIFLIFIAMQRSLWLDEAFSVNVSRKPLSRIVVDLSNDAHPPFYFFFLHFWIKLFGESELATRFSSFLFTF
jgi:uncharacterized membrane protein